MRILLSVFILSVAINANAFTLITTNPNQTGWINSDITFLVNTTNCPIDVPTLINEAAAVWNNVANSSVKVSYAGTTTSTTFANPTTVYCETNFQGVTGANDDSVPGAATVQTSGGRIITGLMYLNASSGDANIANYNYEELKIIIAHEIGHILGLGHSADANALMYYSAGVKAELRLGQDDIDGMSYLYPSDELNGDPMAGCGSIGPVIPPTGPRNSWLAVLLLLIPAIIASRLRSIKIL
jgi:hypothetical protein